MTARNSKKSLCSLEVKRKPYNNLIDKDFWWLCIYPVTIPRNLSTGREPHRNDRERFESAVENQGKNGHVLKKVAAFLYAGVDILNFTDVPIIHYYTRQRFNNFCLLVDR